MLAPLQLLPYVALVAPAATETVTCAHAANRQYPGACIISCISCLCTKYLLCINTLPVQAFCQGLLEGLCMHEQQHCVGS